MRNRWLACCAVLFSPLAFGVQLVNDVNAVPLTEYYGGSGFSNAVQTTGGTVFFTQDQAHGLEPWVTDGTPAGTRLLKDIRPGPQSCGADMVTAMNNVAYFLADDGANGVELWRTDGTTDGTRMVANIGPGVADGLNGPMTIGGKFPVIGNVLYFGADDGATGNELWRTDGTAAGTYRLADLMPGASGIYPYDFRIVGSRLYFRSDEGAAASRLFTSDGTPTGTRQFSEAPQAANTQAGALTVVGDALFFSNDDGTSHGRELWRATASGTASMVADLNTNLTFNEGNSDPAPVGVFGDSMLFTATTSGGGLGFRLMRVTSGGNVNVVLDALYGEITRVEGAPNGAIINFFDPVFGDAPLFFTNGTAAGSGFVDSELRFSQGTQGVVRKDGYLYFFARNGFGATSNIWRTDGTRANLTQVITIDTPVVGEWLLSYNDKFYFPNGRFTDPDHGYEIWTADGTPAGTHLFKDFVPGPDPSIVTAAVFGGKLFFSVFDQESAFEPWVSDGTEANTTRLADLTASYVTGSSEPSILGNIGPLTLFRADDGVNGEEIWATDGTSAGTRRVTDQPDGTGFGSSSGIVAMNGFMLFAGEGPAGTELWRTDGSPAGTTLVKDITPGPASSELRLYNGVVVGGVAYFLANDGTHGLELWRSDGTTAGTFMAIDFVPGADGDALYLYPQSANGLLFMRSSGYPTTLYASNGTAAGTVAVTSAYNIDTQGTFVFQDRFCFRDVVINTGFADFYCTNGAAGNVNRVTDFQSLGVSPSAVYVFGGKLLMSTGGGIYLGDGTPAGLTKISDRQFSSGESFDGGARFAFFTDNGGAPDIWMTDGTSLGTRSMLAGSSVTRANILNGLLAAANDSVVFDVIDPARGPLVWKTDGTATGTRTLFDVDPTGTLADRPPTQFVRNGTRIFFSAFRAGIGNELWWFNTTQPNATDDDATTAFNTAVNIAVAANDADFDSALTTPMVEIVTQPANGTVVANTSTGGVTYTPNAGFAGYDTFVYRVLDAAGNPSNAANVSVTVKAAISTTGPGTAPVGGSSGGGSSSGGGKSGGGGALGIETLLLACLCLARMRRAKLVATSARERENRGILGTCVHIVI